MTVRKALLLWFVFCSSCVSANDSIKPQPTAQIYEYSFKKENYPSGFRDGVVGRVAVNFDSIVDGTGQIQAIITMDNLPDRGGAGVLFIRVSLFLPECTGTPVAVIDYNSQSYNRSVVPQTFAILRNACVQVDYYSRDGNDDLQKVDSFQLMLRE